MITLTQEQFGWVSSFPSSLEQQVQLPQIYLTPSYRGPILPSSILREIRDHRRRKSTRALAGYASLVLNVVQSFAYYYSSSGRKLPADRPIYRSKRQNLANLALKTSDLSGFKNIQSPKNPHWILYVFWPLLKGGGRKWSLVCIPRYSMRVVDSS